MPRHKQPYQQQLLPLQVKEIEPLLTIVEVQKILQLSKPKIYELMNERGLPSFKIDGARRFEKAKLQAWIEQQSNMS
jgi:excisionase family DNA binding protein